FPGSSFSKSSVRDAVVEVPGAVSRMMKGTRYAKRTTCAVQQAPTIQIAGRRPHLMNSPATALTVSVMGWSVRSGRDGEIDSFEIRTVEPKVVNHASGEHQGCIELADRSLVGVATCRDPNASLLLDNRRNRCMRTQGLQRQRP